MRFSYVVKDAQGKTINGTDDAPDEAALIARLQKHGYFVISLKPFSATLQQKTASKAQMKGAFTHTKVKLDDLLILCRQLATMLDSGVTLLRSLDVIALQVESRDLAQTLQFIKKDIEQGSSFSVSLAKHPKVFNQFGVSLAEVGEPSGTMPAVLEKLAFYLEEEAAFRSAIISAIIYPAILLVVSLAAILFFALGIAPRFKALFDSFKVPLPPITAVLLGVFDFIKSKFIVLILTIGAILFLIKKYADTPAGRRQFETLFLKMPTFGKVYRTIVVERFTSQMAILVESGVPILYALDITQRLIGSPICSAVITEIKNNVREGKMLAEPMMKSGFFPPMSVQMIMIGEEIGR